MALPSANLPRTTRCFPGRRLFSANEVVIRFAVLRTPKIARQPDTQT